MGAIEKECNSDAFRIRNLLSNQCPTAQSYDFSVAKKITDILSCGFSNYLLHKSRFKAIHWIFNTFFATAGVKTLNPSCHSILSPYICPIGQNKMFFAARPFINVLLFKNLTLFRVEKWGDFSILRTSPLANCWGTHACLVPKEAKIPWAPRKHLIERVMTRCLF